MICTRAQSESPTDGDEVRAAACCWEWKTESDDGWIGREGGRGETSDEAVRREQTDGERELTMSESTRREVMRKRRSRSTRRKQVCRGREWWVSLMFQKIPIHSMAIIPLLCVSITSNRPKIRTPFPPPSSLLALLFSYLFFAFITSERINLNFHTRKEVNIPTNYGPYFDSAHLFLISLLLTWSCNKLIC